MTIGRMESPDFAKESLLVILLLLVSTAVTSGEDCEDCYCPPLDNRSSVALGWSIKPVFKAFACNREYKQIHMCVQGASRILWYWQSNSSTDFEPVSLDPPDKKLINSNQTLVIRTSRPKDSGKYKVVASDSKGESLTNTFRFDVTGCSNWHEPPLALLPVNETTVLKCLPGESVSIVCEGFYGNCDNGHDICLVQWQIVGDESIPTVITNNSMSRVYVRNGLERLNGSGRTTELKITKVEQSDYSTKFRCEMSSSYGFVRRYLRLHYGTDKPEIPDMKIVEIKTVVITSAVIIVLMVLVLALVFRYRLDAKLLYKKNFAKPPPGDKTYDLTVVFHTSSGDVTEDEHFARYVYNKLEKENYKIFMDSPYAKHNVAPTEQSLDTTRNAMDNSHAVIYITSPNFYANTDCVTLLSTFYENDIPKYFIRFKKMKVGERENFQNANSQPEDKPDAWLTVSKIGKILDWPNGAPFPKLHKLNDDKGQGQIQQNGSLFAENVPNIDDRNNVNIEDVEAQMPALQEEERQSQETENKKNAGIFVNRKVSNFWKELLYVLPKRQNREVDETNAAAKGDVANDAAANGAAKTFQDSDVHSYGSNNSQNKARRNESRESARPLLASGLSEEPSSPISAGADDVFPNVAAAEIHGRDTVAGSPDSGYSRDTGIGVPLPPPKNNS